jgi:hypothetical protein
VIAIGEQARDLITMPESLLHDPWEDPEWLDWWSLTPAQRFAESEKLWATFLALEGSLEPEPDFQSPFYFPEEPGADAVPERPVVNRARRRRVQSRRGRRRPRRP